MTESTAVQEIEDGAAVEAIEDGAAVGALKLAAIQRMYEEAKARITDLPDSCSEPAPNVTDPRPQPGHDQGAALVAALAASCSDPILDVTDAGADTREIYLRTRRPLTACAGTGPAQDSAAGTERTVSRANIVTRMLRQLRG